MARPRTRGCGAASAEASGPGRGAGGAACRPHSAFGAEAADWTAAASSRFAGAARQCLRSALTFAGEVVTTARVAAGCVGAVAESDPAGSFGAEGQVGMGHFAETPRRSVSAGVFAGEGAPPAGAAFRRADAAVAPSGPGASFGAEVVTPAGMAFRCAAASGPGTSSFGAEVSAAPSVGAAFRCAPTASDRAASFGAEVSSAAARLPVRRPRGGRAGSWRSTASRTSRPRSCPNVRCGSTCDSSPLSCSNPLRQSSSITALSSHRPAPNGRIRSAGAVNSGSTPASNFSTCRELLPAACSTSACRADESSTGAALRFSSAAARS